MSLKSPNLDDRDWATLVAEARAHIRRRAPEWSDLSPHDPGMVLVEVFAHLTETLLFRLNRVPEKVQVELLRLLGVQLLAPVAARAELTLELERPLAQTVVVPIGTRVQAERPGGGENLAFCTARHIEIPGGQLKARVPALHAEPVRGVSIGKGSGQPGLCLRLPDATVVARSPETEVELGVEASSEELEAGAPGREYEGRMYRLWREVESFANEPPHAPVFVLDRATRLIRFAPAREQREDAIPSSSAALGGVPAAGRQIRAWYWRGGGPLGNVAAGTLNKLAPLSGQPPGAALRATNPEPAGGGRSRESMASALTRGPESLRTLDRAVTAQDFEILARRASREISRARAFTAAEVWKHAPAGSVEVRLVPDLPETATPSTPRQATLDALASAATEERRRKVQLDLDARRPIGTRCVVRWARYKRVTIKARVVAHPGEDLVALKQRVLQRLYAAVSPLPAQQGARAWAFGEPLRASHVWRVALAEAGVSYVDGVRFVLDDAPREVSCIEADPVQPSTWYAAGGSVLYRSLNDGASWESVATLPGTGIGVVRRHPQLPGLLAVAVRLGREQSQLHWSRDAGESWVAPPHTMPLVHDLAWTLRDGKPQLWMATEVGLYELDLGREPAPLLVEVDPKAPQQGFYAIAAAVGERGDVKLAAAATELGGVFLSRDGGLPGTFQQAGLSGKDVRLLAVQYDGSRSFLWAGLAAHGPRDPGEGCCAAELTGTLRAAPNWSFFDRGWKGGSCKSLAFPGPGSAATALAGTHSAGVLRINIRNPETASWSAAPIDCGLPHASAERLFDAVPGVAARDPVVMACGKRGVFASDTEATRFVSVSEDEVAEKVVLPETWLFCSGEHQLEVVSRDEAL